MKSAAVPVVAGTEEVLVSVDAALSAAGELGFPLMLKAVSGGGGRGMRVARDADELARVFPVAQLQAQSHFGNGGLYLERLIEPGHHVELPIAAHRRSNATHPRAPDTTPPP